MSYPDSAESVALELFRLIKEVEPQEARGRNNVPESARLLDLYVQCLAATRGDRMMPSTQLLQ